MMQKTIWATLGFGLAIAMANVGCGGSPPPAAAPTTTAADADDDGIPDSDDKCPDKKEDGKGAAPKDGCPDTK